MQDAKVHSDMSNNRSLDQTQRGADNLPRPYAIGINCTKVDKLRNLIHEFEHSAEQSGLELPHLVVYPDGAAGLVYDTLLQEWVADAKAEILDGPGVQKAWHAEVADIVTEVRQRNAWKGILVGGCCRVGQMQIAQLRKALPCQLLVIDIKA